MKRLSSLCLGLFILSLLVAGNIHAAPPYPLPGLSGQCGTVYPTGADDTALIQAALIESETLPSRCLRFGPYTYKISGAQGTLFEVHADNMDIGGTTQTRLEFPPSAELTGELWVWRLWGAGQQIHDLAIQGAKTWGGIGFWGAVSVYDGAQTPHIYNLDISGIWGDHGAGGTGIALYQPWSTSNGSQYALVEHNYIHDGAGQGIGINSSNNQIIGNLISHMGVNGYQHCLYLQGGYNTIRENTLVSCGGFNIHAYFDVQDLDASGNVIEGNYSENPGEGHLWAQPWGNTGVNPRLPAGTSNARFLTVSHNQFVGRDGSTAYGIILYVPTIVEGNSFEDVQRGDVGAINGAVNVPLQVVGNTFTTFQSTQAGPQLLLDGADTLVSGNSFTLRQPWQTAISVRGTATGTQILGNTFTVTRESAAAITVAAPQVQIRMNSLHLSDSAARWAIGVEEHATPLFIVGNTIQTKGNTWAVFWVSPLTAQTRIMDNILTGRLDQSGPGIIFRDNFTP